MVIDFVLNGKTIYKFLIYNALFNLMINGHLRIPRKTKRRNKSHKMKHKSNPSKPIPMSCNIIPISGLIKSMSRHTHKSSKSTKCHKSSDNTGHHSHFSGSMMEPVQMDFN